MSQEPHWVIMREWNQCQIQIPYLSLINNLKWFFVNFVSKKLDPLTWSEQMHVDHKQATQVKYMLCQANNRSPTFLSCDCSLQHKLCPPHHPSQFSTWFHQSCDQLHKALWSNHGLYLRNFSKNNRTKKNDWLEFQLSQIHVCLHKIWNSSRENWNPLISPQG